MSTHSFTPIRTDKLAIAATGATGSTGAPGNARACLISVQTSNAYITFDGSNPGVGATGPAHVFPAGLVPTEYHIGPGARIAAMSTAAATGTNVDITWLE